MADAHETPAFHYIDCLGRIREDTKAVVSSVAFNVSRYGRHTHTIAFVGLVTEHAAIAAVEAFLSQPLTEAYYAVIKDDLWHDAVEWADAQTVYKNRGKCLTSARYLERTYRTAQGRLTLGICS